MTRIRAFAATSLIAVAVASCGGSTTTKTVTKTEPVPSTTTAASLTTSTTSTSTPVTTSATSLTSTSSTTTTTASATTLSAAPVYFAGAIAGGKQRPSSLQLTADGTLAVSGVQWTSWGGPVATGTGNAEYHGCTPNCASATPHTALVAIRLSTTRVCGGRRYYSSVTLRMNSGKLLDQGFLQRSWSPC